MSIKESNRLPNDVDPELKPTAYDLVSVLSSAYRSEKTFSKIKYIKSHYRSALTD